MVNSSTNSVIIAQNYLTFTNSVLQNVQVGASGCVVTNAVTADTTTFDAVLQNSVCNSNSSCSTNSPAASISFASGSLSNPPAHGDFRVAQIAFCAVAAGDAVGSRRRTRPRPRRSRGARLRQPQVRCAAKRRRVAAQRFPVAGRRRSSDQCGRADIVG